jgi:nicotinamide-nucleotide amidase
MSATTEQLAKQLGEALKKHKWKLVTAESCTAGGLAYAVTCIPGSSAWFERGFITYSNLSKQELLGVKPITLKVFGAVSEPIVHEMAEGALRQSQAHVSMAITGIAGPEGGTADKPVGTVWFAWSGIEDKTHSYIDVFAGNRAEVRDASIKTALKKLIDYLNDRRVARAKGA